MRAMAFATAAALLLAGPALADSPISTAAAGPAPPQATAPPAPIPSLGDVSASGPPVALGPCGPEKVKADGHLETKPHGEVEVGVGTGGYRHVGGVVCQPVGDRASVTVGFSQTQDNGRYRRH